MFKISLFFILLLGISNTAISQVSVYSCGSFGVLTEEIITQSEPEYYGTCIDFNDDNYSFSNGQYNIVTASESIHLKDGIHSGQFTNGQMHLRLGEKSDFDVAVMNYPDLDGVLKFEKFELGIDLPADIQTKVDNFVNNASVPLTEKLNPYLDWEIRVYTKFNHYSSGEEVIIDGFYTQEFTEFMNPLGTPNTFGITDLEYNNFGGYNLNLTQYSFRTRFAPTQIGLWKAQVFIVRAGITEESAPFDFSVIESDNKGYIHTSINGRYLELGDKTFIPVGCNAPWPRTEKVFDPEFAEYTMAHNYNTNEAMYMTEEYRPYSKMVPRAYDKYKETLQKLIDGGANAFRVIMIPFAFDVEFGQLGNYTSHQTNAQELDQLIDFVENQDVFIQLNTDVQYKYMLRGVSNYWFNNSWDDGGIYGPNNAYKDIPGIQTPLDFFSNETAKTYYKQRLRYILARWGYSTQISILELMSEENQVGNNFSNAADHSSGLQEAYLNNLQTYVDWNIEMGSYIKSFHNGKCHLLTCSYAGLPHEDDYTYTNDNFDVIGVNCYDNANISFGTYPITLLSKYLLNRQAEALDEEAPNGGSGLKRTFEYTGLKTKPIVFAETGFSASSVAYKSDCGYSVAEYKRLMWQLPFSGLAGSYAWDVWYLPPMYNEFNNLKQFINQFDFGDVNELWIPGASISDNYTNGGDYYSFVEDAYEHMENEKEYKADMVYMVKKDRSMAVGVLTNKTYNLYTSSQNGTCEYYPMSYDPEGDGSTLGPYWEAYGTNKKHILNKYVQPFSIYPEEVNNPLNELYQDYSNFNHSFAVDVETNNVKDGDLFNPHYLALWNMQTNVYGIFYEDHTGGSTGYQVVSSNGQEVNISTTLNGNENEFIKTFIAVPQTGIQQTDNPNIDRALLEIQQNYNLKVKDTSITDNMISIHPNPFRDKIYISSSENIKELSLIDVSGKIIFAKVINEYSFELSLSSLSNGIYLLETTDNKMGKKQFKILKQ
jgi:Secretion system C-terminal sorting domain